jgi:hypothetical protein
VDFVFAGESWREPASMFFHSPEQIVSDTDVSSARTVGQDVNKIVSHRVKRMFISTTNLCKGTKEIHRFA